MKVLFASFPAITLLGGGVETQMMALAKELSLLGCNAELFNPWQRYDLRGYELFHLFGAHIGTYHLGRAIRSIGVRLAVSPEFYSRHRPERVRVALRMAMALRRHGGFWTEHVICHELCSMADLLLPNTGAEASMLEQGLVLSSKRMCLLPNGVDERFADAKPEEFASIYGSGFILYVGHIGWARKNVLALLRVVEQMGYPTILVGPVVENDYGRRCIEVVRRNNHITLIPGLPHESTLLASAYAACSVMVLPSLYETPGLAALEAGLAGAKICITRHGGTVEYFGDDADYLEPGSLNSIRSALEKAIARPHNDALRERIAKRFLWRHAAQRALEAYKGTA